MRTLSNTFAVALIAAVAGASLLAPTNAEAGKVGKDVVQKNFDFATPHDGYEGFSNVGGFCSYYKTPIRVCKKVRGGKKCKKVWRLTQTCQ